MRIIRFELTIHNIPITIRRQPIKWNIQLLPDCAPCSIRANEILRPHDLHLPTLHIPQRRRHRILTHVPISNLKLLDSSRPLNNLLMPQQIADIHLLQLPLRYNVDPAIPITTARISAMPEFDPVAENDARVDIGPFIDGFFDEAPGLEVLA